MENNNFHTFGEYMKKDSTTLTASMEDYLEMLYRLSLNTGFVRIHELSQALNIQPPSATKMVQRLKKMELLKYEKYGFIMLEEKGKELGAILLNRHKKIEALLRFLNVPENILLSETEKIEHTMSSETIACIEHFIEFVSKNPELFSDFKSMKELSD